MSYVHYPAPRRVLRKDRYPWLAFLFVSILFFLTSHDPSGAQRTLDDYNRSQDDIVQGVSSGSSVRQGALLGLGFASVLSMVCYAAPRRLFPTSAASYLLCAFVGWCAVSFVWADDPSITLKRFMAFSILCITGVSVVRMFSLRQIVMLIFFITASYLVIAIASEILAGAFKPWASGYRFAGTQHPNGEGTECGILVLSGVAAWTVDRKRLWIYRAFTAAGALFLLLTASRTSLIATSLAVTVYFLMAHAKRSKKIVAGLAIVLGCIMLLLLCTGLKPLLTDALSKQRDEGASVGSFAGRTDIWRDVTGYILERPVAGHGYGGFWTPDHIKAISDEEKWGVPDSHSAYVDYLLTVGAVGLLLYLACLAQGIWRSLSLARLTGLKELPFLTGVLIFGTIDGFFESSIGEGSLLTFLCIIALSWIGFVPVFEPQAASAPALRYGAEGVLP